MVAQMLETPDADVYVDEDIDQQEDLSNQASNDADD